MLKRDVIGITLFILIAFIGGFIVSNDGRKKSYKISPVIIDECDDDCITDLDVKKSTLLDIIEKVDMEFDAVDDLLEHCLEEKDVLEKECLIENGDDVSDMSILLYVKDQLKRYVEDDVDCFTESDVCRTNYQEDDMYNRFEVTKNSVLIQIDYIGNSSNFIYVDVSDGVYIFQQSLSTTSFYTMFRSFTYENGVYKQYSMTLMENDNGDNEDMGLDFNNFTCENCDFFERYTYGDIKENIRFETYLSYDYKNVLYFDSDNDAFLYRESIDESNTTLEKYFYDKDTFNYGISKYREGNETLTSIRLNPVYIKDWESCELNELTMFTYFCNIEGVEKMVNIFLRDNHKVLVYDSFPNGDTIESTMLERYGMEMSYDDTSFDDMYDDIKSEVSRHVGTSIEDFLTDRSREALNNFKKIHDMTIEEYLNKSN